MAAEDQLELLLRLPEGTPLFHAFQRALKPLSAESLEHQLEVALSKADDRSLARILFFAASSGALLTSRTRQIVATAMSSADETVALCAADVAYRVQDPELNTLVLDIAATARWTLDPSESSFYHGRAIASAVVQNELVDAVSMIQPQFLAWVATTLKGEFLDRFAELTERSLAAMLGFIGVDMSQGFKVYLNSSANGLNVWRWVEDVEEPKDGAGLDTLKHDLVDMEAGGRRRAERHQQMIKAMQMYEKELAEVGAAAVSASPGVNGLRELVNHNPERVGNWLDAILRTSDARILSQARNLGLSLAGAYAAHDAATAAIVLQKLRDTKSIVDVSIDRIGLYEHALFTANDTTSLAPLRAAIFTDAFDDAVLERATIAAEICGSGTWLDGFVDELIASHSLGEQARGITIASFREPNSQSERILTMDWGTGFLGDVVQFAQKSYRRNTWARTWFEAAMSATDPVNFWRFAKLSEGVVDARYLTWMKSGQTNAMSVRFGAELYEAFEKAAEKRSKKRRETLFGHKAPKTDLVRALRDRHS